MKKLFIFLLVALIITNCESYGQRFGIKFAWSNSEYSSLSLNQDKSQLYQGYQLGFYGRSDSRIYLQPEVYYHKKEGKFTNEPGMPDYNASIATYNQSVTLHTLNVPLVLGLNVIKHKNFTLHGFGGVQACVVVDNSISSTYIFTPITKSNIQNIAVKYFYGIGLDLFFLSFDIRYYTESSEPINASNDITFKSLKNYYTFNLGLKILK